MNDYVAPLLRRYRRAGLLIDTNILLLLFVGNFERRLIARFKRTAKFGPEDHDLVTGLFPLFERIVTTPNILTEVSNLAGQLESHQKPGYFAAFARSMALLEEQYIPSVDIGRMTEFDRLGLTDAGILRVARGGYLVLTDDFRLAGLLDSAGVAVLNFEHLRFGEITLQ